MVHNFNRGANCLKTILLTGATGFLGSNILKKFLSLDYELIILKRSFSNVWRIQECLSEVTSYNLDEMDLSQLFEKRKIDVVLHCATDYGRKTINPIELVQANLMLPLRLLHLSLEYNVKVFVNTDTILDKRVSQYSLSKKQFFEWLQLYSNKLVCINVALEHFYGPMDDDSKFLSFVVKQLLEGVPSIALTAGEQKRDFIYIDDVVSAFLTILPQVETKAFGFYEFQIGTGKTTRIKDVIEKAKLICGNEKSVLNFGALPYRYHEVMESSVDLQAISALGWKPTIELKDGLQRMIELEKKRLVS